MATNDFLPFAVGGSANVVSQSVYAALGAVTNGYQSGVANSAQINKTFRQSSIMAAVLAQFIADQTGVNSVDDGTTATLLANLKKAMPGRLLRTTIYTLVSGVQNVSVDGGTPTSTGATSFTALAATSFVEIECQGGGGGGGGVSTNGSQPATAGGAGAGGYGRGRYTTGFSSLVITVGAGGAGGAAGNNFGSGGGSSSAGALLSAPGGFSGAGGVPTAAPFFNGGSNQSSAPTGANLYAIRGQAGQYGIVLGNVNVAGGIGGGSFFGNGSPSVANTAGAQAINYGAGGGGASAQSALSINQGGGAGANGIVIIREYA